ncbi:hypothetical protein [uncultured Dialister sp.]|uniref:hypothetical protein n=1 Tax=uncultured Dialister sp. TaxID=278064 RepID=UPI00206E2C64|nr:hypothetical protein [uncultured Dialister sp.]DAZ68447.1 MAG TPA: 43 kDa tail protein [Caudoviricetes sp.]
MNIVFGRRLFGRWIFSGNVGSDKQGGRPENEVREFYPGEYSIYAYAKNGTRTAIFGSNTENNALSKVTFEITETGCGACELTFHKLPSRDLLTYMQRIDIHLFGDTKPWYSGYIISRPVEGTTEDSYVFKGHGYYNQLSSILIFKTYEHTDVGAIARDIAVMAEQNLGLVYNAVKIPDVGYFPEKLVFDGVTAKEALGTLSNFAIDHVYGVDEYRSLYFKPRNHSINEQARLTVGKHIASYKPSWDVDKVFNWARVKGGNIDSKGEQWLCIVEDKESQAAYGLRQKVLSLPSAYSVNDAKRWGENQIAQYKAPVRSAKIMGVRLEYPYPDGTFNVRHMGTDGKAQIRTLDGSEYEYPITKIKYTISAKDGIKADMELGEPPFAVDRYLFGIERAAKDIEQAQSSAIRQLKT